MSPRQLATSGPTSSKRTFASHEFCNTFGTYARKESLVMIHNEDGDMDAEFTPDLVSNNSPSLVSDDGEYEDLEDGSSQSDCRNGMGAESFSHCRNQHG